MTNIMPNMVSRFGSGGGSRGIGWISFAPLPEGWLAVSCGGWLLGGLCDKGQINGQINAFKMQYNAEI